MYGYDPLHNQDEISMFLTLSISLVLVERCKHEYQKPNNILSQRKIFSKLKIFYENNSIKSVCVYVLEQSTNYSILYILSKNKNKILYLDTSLDLEVFP